MLLGREQIKCDQSNSDKRPKEATSHKNWPKASRPLNGTLAMAVARSIAILSPLEYRATLHDKGRGADRPARWIHSDFGTYACAFGEHMWRSDY
jgi:hypothetical protein